MMRRFAPTSVAYMFLLAALVTACNTFQPEPDENKVPVVTPVGGDDNGNNAGGNTSNGGGNTSNGGSNTPNGGSNASGGDTTAPDYIIRAGVDGVKPCGIDIDTRKAHDGTESAPYTPCELLTDTDILPVMSSTWIYGYAVGYADGAGQWHYTAADAAADNVLVSDVPADCYEGNTLLVELTDEATQGIMSLAARPDSLGRLVRFYGRTVSRGKHGGYCMQTDATYSSDWLR